jgi:hypothetical protein
MRCIFVVVKIKNNLLVELVPKEEAVHVVGPVEWLNKSWWALEHPVFHLILVL